MTLHNTPTYTNWKPIPPYMRHIAIFFFFLFFADWCLIAGVPFDYVISKDDFTQMIVVDGLLLLIAIISFGLPIINKRAHESRFPNTLRWILVGVTSVQLLPEVVPYITTATHLTVDYLIGGLLAIIFLLGYTAFRTPEPFKGTLANSLCSIIVTLCITLLYCIVLMYAGTYPIPLPIKYALIGAPLLVFIILFYQYRLRWGWGRY
ncbi:MAG: hypothetical protein EBS29_03255 [Chloroflexia bacterium]|nr:hypothetical protein [Chloroflexia bacterium]